MEVASPSRMTQAFHPKAMKPVPILIRVLLCLLSVAGLQLRGLGAESPPQPLTVAVLDFEASDDLKRDLGKEIATLLTAHLAGNPGLWMVERAELDRLLAEQAFGTGGFADPTTAARVGQMTGAKVLVTGRALRSGKDLLLVAKVIGVETSRVYGETARSAQGDPVSAGAEELAAKVAATVTGKGETLVGKPSGRSDRAATLKASLAGKRRPVVSVKIPEVHFGTPAVDPAAQTELTLMFREIGCEVAGNNATIPAEIEITGEAFSEAGLRRAGLMSCRARVEISVRERATGKILIAERQMSVAVDVGEQIAAKRALQQAAVELGERIIPQLVK